MAPVAHAANGDPAESAPESLSLGATLAEQGLTLEEVLPSDPGGWVRTLSALNSDERSCSFGALAEILDPFVLDHSSGVAACTPRVIKVDVNAGTDGAVHGISVAVEGAGLTQAQISAMLGAPADTPVLGGSGDEGLGRRSIAPAILQTAQVCLAVTRAAEDSSIGRAVMALVLREPMVAGAGGGGPGEGKGNYQLPLAMVNSEGNPIAGSVVTGPWLTNRRVNVLKRGDPAGLDGGVSCSFDAHAGEMGWVQGKVSRVDVQSARASFVVQESDDDSGDHAHIGLRPWRVEKKGEGGWWSPNEEVWREMRKRVSDSCWGHAIQWLQTGAVGTLLIMEDMSRPGKLVIEREGGGRSSTGGRDEVIDVKVAAATTGQSSGFQDKCLRCKQQNYSKAKCRAAKGSHVYKPGDGMGHTEPDYQLDPRWEGFRGAGGVAAGARGRWAGPESRDLPVTSSLLAYLEVLYKGRQAELLLCGKRVKRKSLITLMSQPQSYEFALGSSAGGARVNLFLGLSRTAGDVDPIDGAGPNGAEQRLRGFFLYSFRRLLTPYILLQVQRSAKWNGSNCGESRKGLDVIGVLEVELPASRNRQEVLLSAEEWHRLGAETEGCYLAYMAQHFAPIPRAPTKPLGFVSWDALGKADKELAEAEAEAAAPLQAEDGDDAEAEAEDDEGEEASDSGEVGRGGSERSSVGRPRGRGGRRGRGRGAYTLSKAGGYVGDIVDGPRQRKAAQKAAGTSDEDNEDGCATGVGGSMSPKKRGGLAGLRGDGRKRWRAPETDKRDEREAKRMLTSSLTKGQKVWVFNSKEMWPLNSARKLKAMCLAGADAQKVALGRIPPQIGILLTDSAKGWWDVMIQSTGDKIKCRLTNLQMYETGSVAPVVSGEMTATAAKEAAELEQRRNDLRSFLEEASGGLSLSLGVNGRSGSADSAHGGRHLLRDQQLAAVIDLLAGTKSTQMLLLRDKEDVGWGSDKGAQGEKGRGNIQNAADNDQVDYPGEGDLDGLTVFEDRALGGAEGDEEGREDAGRAPRDETSGVEEVRPSSPGGGLPLLAGQENTNGTADGVGRLEDWGGSGKYRNTAEALEALRVAQERRVKAEEDLMLAFSEEDDVRLRLTNSARQLGDALKGWRKDLEKISVAQTEAKTLSSSLWTLCSHHRASQQQNAQQTQRT